LYNGDTWITYEDIEAIKFKADTVKTLGLGGMMYWESTQDSTGDIIKTISDVLNKN
jgi:chitinase